MSETAEKEGYGKYTKKLLEIATRTRDRANKAIEHNEDKWQTHKTARPQVAGGELTTDRVIKKK